MWQRLLVCSLISLSPAAFAANGPHLIGVSPASNALGGTGVANYTNATDALYRNPALLLEETEGEAKSAAEFSFNYFKNNTAADGGAGILPSTNTVKIGPNLAGYHRLAPDVAIALGVISYGGAVNDYKDQPTLVQLKTDFSLVRLAPAVAWRLHEKFAVGVSPYVTYGALALNNEEATGTQTTRDPDARFALGIMGGFAFKPVEAVTIGGTITSKSSFTFRNLVDFEYFNGAPNGLDNVKVQEPMELALGVRYRFTENFYLTGDYRFIEWSKADAYRELGWQDQKVIALGLEFQSEDWKARFGFNYGASPIASNTGDSGAVNFQGHTASQESIARLNLFGFSGTAQSHFTAGAGYRLSGGLSLDAAAQYVPKVRITRSGTGLLANAYSYASETSQWMASIGATYRF